MRRWILVVLLLSMQRTAGAADETVKIGLDCSYWNGALAGDVLLTARVLFVRGMYEGATALHADLFDAAEQLADAGQSAARERELADTFEERYFRQSGYISLVAGLDTFCRNPLNSTVWLTSAMRVVSMQLRDEALELIEMQIARARQTPGP